MSSGCFARFIFSSPAFDPGPRDAGDVLAGASKVRSGFVIGLWSIPLTQKYIGKDANGAYLFAWGFGFIQFVLEFGMSSALQKQMVDAYTRGDRGRREPDDRLAG